MSSSTGVAKEIASVITGILLLFSATGIYIKHVAQRTRAKRSILPSSNKNNPNGNGGNRI